MSRRIGQIAIVVSDHQLSDIGVMNFAVWLPSQADFQTCYQHCQ